MFATSGDPCGWDKNILRDWIDDRERVPAQDQQARSERGIAVSFDQRHGKGSHGTLRFGNRKDDAKGSAQGDWGRLVARDARPARVEPGRSRQIEAPGWNTDIRRPWNQMRKDGSWCALPICLRP